MTLYLDSSALVTRYVEEPGSARCVEAMQADGRWFTARHTLVETTRALSRALPGPASLNARQHFDADWSYMQVVELDSTTCALALDAALETGARTLDALHLAAMWRIGGDDVHLLTMDVRQARAAQQLGLAVHPASVAG